MNTLCEASLLTERNLDAAAEELHGSGRLVSQLIIQILRWQLLAQQQ